MTKQLSILERTAICLSALFGISVSVYLLTSLVLGSLVFIHPELTCMLVILSIGLLGVSAFGMVMTVTGREP